MTFDSSTLLIIVAVLGVLILAFLIVRPRLTRVEKRPRDAQPYVASHDRPYIKNPPNDWVTDEAAAATLNVASEVLNFDRDEQVSGPSDDLCQLKGVGPKYAVRLRELGIIRLAQLATLSDAEVAHLDERLGPFRGRLARDRIREQADYLARGDTDGFEEKFGKLGG